MSQNPLIQATDIVRRFRVSPPSGWKKVDRTVLNGVTFSLERGQTLALVGESGSGKSTLAKIVLALDQPTSGTLDYAGDPYAEFTTQQQKRFRRNVQVVLQDPGSSLNPKKTIGRILGDVLKLHRIAPPAELREHVLQILDSVGLARELFDRYPHELSGGQKQRAAIGRAISVNPEVIVADEALSALDVSIQAQVLDLMMQLQKERGVSYLFISHDLNVVSEIAHETMVMYQGRVVEAGPTSQLFRDPQDDYTRKLLHAHW